MRLIINTLLVILVIHYILTEVNLQITLPLRSMFTPSPRGREYYKNKSSKKKTQVKVPTPAPANDTQQEQQEQPQMMEEMANYESSMPNKRMFNNETRDGTGDYRIDRYYEPGIGGIKEVLHADYIHQIRFKYMDTYHIIKKMLINNGTICINGKFNNTTKTLLL